GLRVESTPHVKVVFPAVHPEVGDIEIYDDEVELTVVAGNFTHGHFSCYDESLSKEQVEETIVDDVVAFLRELFADRIVLWGAHRAVGGWYRRGTDPWSPSGVRREREYVWSGPLALCD
ncbi:MAG TPA: hypothetical protein VF590_09590, partial [Isosphaeraceae bacterium]